MKPGDVVIVTSKGTDKTTGKSYAYRWFGVVVGVSKSARFCRVYDLVRRVSRSVWVTDTELIEEAFWPDGVRALRAAAILQGDIDI